MRRVAIAGAAAIMGALGFVAFSASGAQADPSICVNLDLNINGTPVVQAICLPPEGAPGVPGLPELPPLPA